MSESKWNAETLRSARKAKNLTQQELALELGCRQQTVSEWELGIYAPKNAYQKILTHYFNEVSAPKEPSELPDFEVTQEQLLNMVKYLQVHGLDSIRISHRSVEETFLIFSAPNKPIAAPQVAGPNISSLMSTGHS